MSENAIGRLRAVVQEWQNENHGESPLVVYAAGVVWDMVGEGVYRVVTGAPSVVVSLRSGAALREVVKEAA